MPMKIICDDITNMNVDAMVGIVEVVGDAVTHVLTRGMKGTYVYCEDKAFGDYLKSLIRKE